MSFSPPVGQVLAAAQGRRDRRAHAARCFAHATAALVGRGANRHLARGWCTWRAQASGARAAARNRRARLGRCVQLLQHKADVCVARALGQWRHGSRAATVHARQAGDAPAQALDLAVRACSPLFSRLLGFFSSVLQL
jgi:hypothetical protein